MGDDNMRYEIKGAPLPVVVCEVEANETLITEKGSMCWMSPNMKMETTTNGGIGKAFGRMFSGEAMFQNRYTAQGKEGMIAFASSFPGDILAFEISKVIDFPMDIREEYDKNFEGESKVIEFKKLR